MSTLSTSLTVAGVALAAAVGITQFTGPSISTQIEIDASPAAVWTVLAETEAYADWNPFIRQINGDLRVGETIYAMIQSGDNAPMEFTPEILVADEAAEIRWIGRLGFRGEFDGEHYFVLEETDQGTTIFHHGENFTGILGYPLLALIRGDTEAGFAAMNAALKARAEARM